MRIKTIKVSGFRLLNNFSIDLEEELSLIIGKNNTGKTSLLLILDKFLNGNKNSWSINDFNINLLEKMEKSCETKLNNDDYMVEPFKIELKLYLEYLPEDSSKNYSQLIMDLDEKNNIYIISFQYILNYENYNQMFEDFQKCKQKSKDLTLYEFLNKNITTYFDILKEVLEFNNETNRNPIEDSVIKKIINLKYISAKRDVVNSDSEKKSLKTLSKLSSIYYDAIPKQGSTEINPIQEEIRKIDKILSKKYKDIFQKLYESFKKFATKESNIEILSNIQETNLLKENSIVKYSQGQHYLPEDYNGLGYLNLFAIIFDIHIKIDELKKINYKKEEPADINLLFIEEPEAHTHPQMQYVFINNIKQMLREETINTLNLQTIISTHSSHITSQSDFNDIKYFIKESESNVIAKNLSNLQKAYLEGDDDEKKRNFQFLKQYLTLNNSELFFANKAIFIEGDTERILMPAIMKKFDYDKGKKLLSQNVSVVEVGNYSHIFEKFLNFLNIKTLIITDIDSVNDEDEACKVCEGKKTSNPSIKHFLSGKNFDEIKTLSSDGKKINNGIIYLAYQTEENNYHARSFEDAFINKNLNFIRKNIDSFNSIKNKKKFEEPSNDAYSLAMNCIRKKSLFATDILYYSDEHYSNWKIPKYIEEGLLWIEAQ